MKVCYKQIIYSTNIFNIIGIEITFLKTNDFHILDFPFFCFLITKPLQSFFFGYHCCPSFRFYRDVLNNIKKITLNLMKIG